MIAETGHVNARLLARLQHGHAFRHVRLDTVDEDGDDVAVRPALVVALSEVVRRCEAVGAKRRDGGKRTRVSVAFAWTPGVS